MSARVAGGILLGMMAASGCGQVDFGTVSTRSENTANDAGVDAGLDDTGVTPDQGVDGGDEELDCLLVTLPPSFPAAWPFATDLTAYEDRFLGWAQTENCVACHNLDRYQSASRAPPLLVRDSEALQPFQGDQAWVISRDLLWETVAASGLTAAGTVGPLWRHHPDRENFVAPQYLDDQILFLESFAHQAWACGIPAHLAPQDAGPACGVPPDGGFPDLGFGPDGGAVDAAGADQGPAVAEPCYCDERPDAGVFDPSLCVAP